MMPAAIAAVVLGVAVLAAAVRRAVADSLAEEARRRERLRREIQIITGQLEHTTERVARLERHYPAEVRRSVTDRAIRRMEGR